MSDGMDHAAPFARVANVAKLSRPTSKAWMIYCGCLTSSKGGHSGQERQEIEAKKKAHQAEH
jgi:hypothetical protein